MMKKFIVLPLLSFALLMFSASCGYRFEGGGYIHEDVTHVAVNVFENQSSETGAGILFTNALIQEIHEKTTTRITDEDTAMAVLKGKINSITFGALSRSSSETVFERSVTAVIDLQLVTKDGDVVWSVINYLSRDDYELSEDQVTDEGNKRGAVEDLSERMAEKLVSKLLTNF